MSTPSTTPAAVPTLTDAQCKAKITDQQTLDKAECEKNAKCKSSSSFCNPWFIWGIIAIVIIIIMLLGFGGYVASKSKTVARYGNQALASFQGYAQPPMA